MAMMTNGKYHTEDECEDARCPVHSKRTWVPRNITVIEQQVCGPDCTDPLRIKGKYCERHYREMFINKAVVEQTFHRLAAERLAGQINLMNAEIKQSRIDQGIEAPKPFMFCANAGCEFKSTNGMAVRTHQITCKFNKRNSVEWEMMKNRKAANKSPKKATQPKAAKKPSGLTEDDLF